MRGNKLDLTACLMTAVIAGAGVLLWLLGPISTVLQGCFISFTIYCVAQNIALIKYNLVGKVSKITRAVFDKTGLLSRWSNNLRMIALLGTILEKVFLNATGSLSALQPVVFLLALNLFTQVLVKVTTDRATLRNPESAAYINKMSAEAKKRDIEVIEKDLVGLLKLHVTELSDEHAVSILKDLIKDEYFKKLSRLRLLGK